MCAGLLASSVPASGLLCPRQPHLGGWDLLVCLGGGSTFGGYDGVRPRQEPGRAGQEAAGSVVGGQAKNLGTQIAEFLMRPCLALAV